MDGRGRRGDGALRAPALAGRAARSPSAPAGAPRTAPLARKAHETIAKVTDDIGRRFAFNTAIAAVMELVNELSRDTAAIRTRVSPPRPPSP